MLTPPTSTVALEKNQKNQKKKNQKKKTRDNLRFSLYPFFKLGGWMLFWLVAIDVAINVLFPYPQSPTQQGSSLEDYFEHGRSIEGKLHRMVGDTVEDSAPIIDAGWVDSAGWRSQPTALEGDDDLFVANYGMSFSDYASLALAEADGKITLRSIGGPSAPVSHSFSMFMADEAGSQADFVIMGVLASSVKRTNSMSGIRWTSQHPAPHLYPYYNVSAQGEISAVEPVIKTARDYVQAFNQQDDIWQQQLSQLEQYDDSFDRFLFYDSLSDRSAIVRLIRAGWAKQGSAYTEEGLYDSVTGFDPNAPEIKTMTALLKKFSATAAERGQVPIILLINDQGYRSDLYEVLSPRLADVDGYVLSTHSIVSPEDPANFISDGHFTTEANRKVGEALRVLIRQGSPNAFSSAFSDAP